MLYNRSDRQPPHRIVRQQFIMPQQIVESLQDNIEKDTDTYAGKQVFPIRFPHVCTFFMVKDKNLFPIGQYPPNLISGSLRNYRDSLFRIRGSRREAIEG